VDIITAEPDDEEEPNFRLECDEYFRGISIPLKQTKTERRNTILDNVKKG